MGAAELFSYYPASSVDVRAAAEAMRGRVGDTLRVVTHVETDHRRAVGAVSGVIETSMRDAPRQVVEQSTRVLRTAEYAAGCLAYFGWAIDFYNLESCEPRSINKLNRAYSTAIGEACGLRPLPDDATDAQVAAWSERLERRARHLASALRAEKLRLDAQLDDHALEVQQMLDRGPNSADLRFLWRHAALPPYAPVVFPETPFDDVRTPPDLQEDLVEYLLAHPDELLVPDPAYAALLASLPAELRRRLEVGRHMESLRRREPRSRYEEWLAHAVERGLTVDEVLAQIVSEDVTPEGFDVLDGLERIVDPDGRSYVVLDSDSVEDVRAIVEAVELLNGGLPSASAWRRDANAWSYEEDVPYILDGGGALLATPEGILIGMASDEIVDEKELFSQGAGTMWGEVFLLDGHPDDPRRELREMIQWGRSPNCAALPELLHHERVHAEQWARYGYWGMLKEYAAESVEPPGGLTWDSPHQTLPRIDVLPNAAEPEDNALEVEAGLEDGGYVCDDDPRPEA